jgi:hypothetical protein
MKNKTRLLIPGFLLVLSVPAIAQTARVQVIHNSADAAAAVVDVYVNNGATPAIDNFAFRTATPFIDLPAGVDITVGIAPGNSAGPQDIIPGLSYTYVLNANETYVLVANGIVSGSGYDPAPAFGIDVFAPGRESAAVAGNTDILVVHGSTDAPTVQVAETAVLGGAVVVPPFSYGEFSSDYLEVPAVDLTLEIQLPDGTPVVAYDAPLNTLGLADAALVALASGFLDPTMNSNGPAFGIWVALPSGGPLVELPVSTGAQTARLQVIHNSADAAAASVDVYVNGALLLNDFAFRTATPYVDVPAGVDLTIGIAPSTSMSAADAIAEFAYNLTAGATYVLVANGIVSSTGYSPATAFDLYASEGRESSLQAMNTDVLVFHGSTDAPVVDVAETAVLGGAVIVDDIAYGEFQGYLEVAAVDLVLQVQTTDGTPVVAYQAPLATLDLAGEALVVLASGFLDPSMNSNGPGFGLFVALPSGGPLVALPLATGTSDRTENSMNIWPNPANGIVNIQLENTDAGHVRLLDAVGRVVIEEPILDRTSTFTLDVSMVPAGAYFLQTQGGSTTSVMISR